MHIARWYHIRSIFRSVVIRPRVYLAALTVVVMALVLPPSLPASLRVAMAGDVGFLVYIALALRIMGSCTRDQLRKRAAVQDDSGLVILVLILVGISMCFLAVVGVLSDAKNLSGIEKVLHIVLAAVTIAVSWLMTQVVFTFHYAHEYYRPDDHAERVAGGLDFPGDANPDYWDFFYFSTSLGAASQTSDVMIRTKALRRLVTVHAIVSFFFNTAVLAMAINIGASLI
ncbi:MAG: DUF1345 domain-containing protein [Hyphomicrobiaceae bacterium]|nr:DUF1345 domain-containing protein [Hyphomicrobiaceae bacterium]